MNLMSPTIESWTCNLHDAWSFGLLVKRFRHYLSRTNSRRMRRLSVSQHHGHYTCNFSSMFLEINVVSNFVTFVFNHSKPTFVQLPQHLLIGLGWFWLLMAAMEISTLERKRELLRHYSSERGGSNTSVLESVSANLCFISLAIEKKTSSTFRFVFALCNSIFLWA